MSSRHDFACDLLRHAEAFREAAIRLHAAEPFLYHPTFYCALHAIELGLKTHLAFHGFSKKQLRDLGHNLGALVTEAHDKELIPFLDGHQRKAITFGGKSYSKKCFEYPEFIVSTLPIGRWLQFAELLTFHASSKKISP